METIELVGGITALAYAMCHRLSIDEMVLAAGVLVQLGDTIATIAAQSNLYNAEKKGQPQNNGTPS